MSGLLIDDRIGSRHLQSLIRDSELSRLDAGDVCWAGADGSMVGVEVKKVSDAVSCMFSGRLADHQLPLMTKLYDYRYLVIEGQYRPDPVSGVMQRWLEFDSKKEVRCGKWIDAQCGRQRLMFSSFESWLSTMEILGGVRVRNTSSVSQTAALLVALYNWWQRSNHRSFDVMHEFEGNGANLTRPGTLRRILADVDEIGWKRSGALLKRFRGVRFITKDGRIAEPSDFILMSTRKDGVEFHDIGMERAKRIVEGLEHAK